MSWVLLAIQLALGALFLLAVWRTWFVGATALLAFGFGLSRRPFPLGRQRQVPREWNQTTPSGRRYLLWGAMRGFGLATPILTSAFLALLSAQATAGLAVGALYVSTFGIARHGIASLPAVCRLDPGATTALLPKFRSTVRRLHALVALDTGLMLVLLAWH
jgi:hypothetical protein